MKIKTIFLCLILLIAKGFTEVVEFNPLNPSELVIPANQSIRVISCAKKGPLSIPSFRLTLSNTDSSTATHYFSPRGLLGGYFNGPASITIDPLSTNSYSSNDLSSTGLLLCFERITNQPYQIYYASSPSTNTLVLESGKKLRLINRPITGITQGDSIIKIRGYLTNVLNSGMSPEIWPQAGFEIDGPETIIVEQAIPWGGFGGGPTTSYYFNYQILDIGSSTEITDTLVASVAERILSATNNYGLATKAELTQSLSQSRVDGINSVISNPNLWTLYTTSQIQSMAVGDLILTRTNQGQFILNYDIEQSEDLQTWIPYQSFVLPLVNLPTNKAFVRIKAKQ